MGGEGFYRGKCSERHPGGIITIRLEGGRSLRCSRKSSRYTKLMVFLFHVITTCPFS